MQYSLYSSYDKVILHVSKAIPDNIKEALSKQDVSTVKKEMLSLIEEALGLKEAVNITGLDLKTDMTAEEISLETVRKVLFIWAFAKRPYTTYRKSD